MIKICLNHSDHGQTAEAEAAQVPTAEDDTPWTSWTFSTEPLHVGRYDATGPRVATLSSGRGPNGWTISFGLDRQTIPSPTIGDHDPWSGCAQERTGRTVDDGEPDVSVPPRHRSLLRDARSPGGGMAAGPGSPADLEAQSAAPLRAAMGTVLEMHDVFAVYPDPPGPTWRPILVQPERSMLAPPGQSSQVLGE